MLDVFGSFLFQNVWFGLLTLEKKMGCCALSDVVVVIIEIKHSCGGDCWIDC